MAGRTTKCPCIDLREPVRFQQRRQFGVEMTQPFGATNVGEATGDHRGAGLPSETPRTWYGAWIDARAGGIAHTRRPAGRRPKARQGFDKCAEALCCAVEHAVFSQRVIESFTAGVN